jgi:hypothetical protein
LSAFDSTVTGNTIIASPGLDVRSGGLFTSEPVTFEHVLIQGNRPDDTDARQAGRPADPTAAQRAMAPRAERSSEAATIHAVLGTIARRAQEAPR